MEGQQLCPGEERVRPPKASPAAATEGRVRATRLRGLPSSGEQLIWGDRAHDYAARAGCAKSVQCFNLAMRHFWSHHQVHRQPDCKQDLT